MAKRSASNSMSRLFSASSVVGIVVVACIWFSALMGSGTSTGNNQMNFFIRFGYIGVATACFMVLLQVWTYYWGIELARITKTYHYSAWIREVTYPYDKIGVPLFDVLNLISMPIFAGSALAGGAELMSEYLGISYFVGVAIMAGIFLFIAVSGVKALGQASSILSFLIIIMVVYFLAVGIPANWGNAMRNIANQVMGEGVYSSIGFAILFAVLFTSIQISSLASMPVAIEGKLRSKRDTKGVCLIAGTMLTIAFVGLCIVLLGRFPGNLSEEIFVLEAIQSLDNPLISFGYPLLLFCAFVSSGTVIVFAQSDRWTAANVWNNLQNDHILRRYPRIRKAVVAVLFLLLSFIFSIGGFGFVTQYLFVIVAVIYLPTVFFPVAVLMPLRVRRMRRELRQTGNTTTAHSLRTDK